MNAFYISTLLCALNFGPDFQPNPLNSFYKEQIGQDINFYTESGYVSVDDDVSGSINKYFYHLFLKDGATSMAKINDDDIFLLWLGGGPGCSSQFGNFMEAGPFQATKDGGLKLRDKSWNKFAHIMFVDQPFNVGLSYSSDRTLVRNTDLAAEYFTKFLKKFYEQYAVFQSTQLYIVGESYAGHFIPAIGEEILKIKMKKLINFKGVAIAAGWTNPFHQMSQYGSFLHSIGVVDQYQRDIINKHIMDAQTDLINQDFLGATKKFHNLKSEVMKNLGGGMNLDNFQMYYHEQEHGRLDNFMNLHLSTFKAEHIPRFTECNKEIYELFSADISTNREQSLIAMLRRGIKVLLYNGQLDYFVNTSSALKWVSQLKWENMRFWKTQHKKIFKALNPATNQVEPVGNIKHFDKLFYAVVYRAGHTVAQDNPNAAYSMIQHFINEDNWEQYNG